MNLVWNGAYAVEFDYIIVPICAIVCFIMCLKDQNNKIALIIGGGCIGMQIVLADLKK